MIVEAKGKDIVYTPYFSGVYGSYLRASVTAAGFDPDNLPAAPKTKIGQAVAGSAANEAKAWRDVWSAGQGVGSIDDIPSVAEMVARLDKEYRAALTDFDRVRFDRI